jgi:hypothetical protein
VALSMVAMSLPFIQERRWWFFPFRNFAQDFRIGFEQGIHGLNNLACYSTKNTHFSSSFACAWIIGTFGFDKSLIEFGPLSVSAN